MGEMIRHKENWSIWQYLAEILKDNPLPVIFEIGMREGEEVSRITHHCELMYDYYGFEPDPRNVKVIERMLPDLMFQINFFPMAVGNVDGKCDFYLSDGVHPQNGNRMTGASSLRKPKGVADRHKWISWDKTVEVGCVKLDSFCQQQNVNNIDFIWADMQGGEYDMILGGIEILKNTKAMVVEFGNIELYEGQKTLDDYLELLNKECGTWELVHKWHIDALLINTNTEIWEKQ